MELALFTPGAYIWPVLRNFEVFIASLGSSASGAIRLTDSSLYPAAPRFVPDLSPRSPELDTRLERLHRELYTALLRPSSLYSGSTETIEDVFWPDLAGTSCAALLDALLFCFLRRSGNEASVQDGLSVLRTVFFNHEATEPRLWLHYARERLKDSRTDLPEHTAVFELPTTARYDDLSFCIIADIYSSTIGPGRMWGSVQRRLDGTLQCTAQCLLDPETAESSPAGLGRHLRASVDTVLGSREAAAA